MNKIIKSFSASYSYYLPDQNVFVHFQMPEKPKEENHAHIIKWIIISEP